MVARTASLTAGLTVNEQPDGLIRPFSVNGYEPSLCPLTDTITPYRFRFIPLTGTSRVAGTLLGTRYMLYPASNPGYDPIRYRDEGSVYSQARATITTDRVLTVTEEHS